MNSFTSLALAGMLTLVSSGTAPLPIAMWLAPVFLLRFVHLGPTPSGFALMFATFYAVVAVVTRALTPFQGMPYFAFIFLMVGTQMLPYFAERVVALQLPGFSATLVFPLAYVSVEFISMRLSPGGSWFSTAYSQYGNLALMQVASVTGLSGITFLVAWFASTVNWAWDRHFAWESVSAGVLTYAGVFSVVILAGAARVAFAASDMPSFRAAAISYPKDLFLPGEVTRIVKADVPADHREEYRTKTARLQDWFLESSRQEAQSGAKLIVWPEANLLVFKEDEPAFLERAQRLAREHALYLLMGMASIRIGARRPLENKAVLVAPSGEIAFSHQKGRPVPGWEAELSNPDGGPLPVVDTKYGRIAAAICFEMDFPQLIRQVGAAGADVLLAPSNDWEAIKQVHAAMAVFRGVENGVSIVRATSSGLSIATDPFGRVLAVTDHFAPGARVMVAQVPTARVHTLYRTVGDLFAWLCVGGFAAAIALAVWARIG
jgi:apolipoprotein N-acyltransferase